MRIRVHNDRSEPSGLRTHTLLNPCAIASTQVRPDLHAHFALRGASTHQSQQSRDLMTSTTFARANQIAQIRASSQSSRRIWVGEPIRTRLKCDVRTYRIPSARTQAGDRSWEFRSVYFHQLGFTLSSGHQTIPAFRALDVPVVYERHPQHLQAVVNLTRGGTDYERALHPSRIQPGPETTFYFDAVAVVDVVYDSCTGNATAAIRPRWASAAVLYM